MLFGDFLKTFLVKNVLFFLRAKRDAALSLARRVFEFLTKKKNSDNLNRIENKKIAKHRHSRSPAASKPAAPGPGGRIRRRGAARVASCWWSLIHWVNVMVPKIHWVNVLVPKDFGLIGTLLIFRGIFAKYLLWKITKTTRAAPRRRNWPRLALVASFDAAGLRELRFFWWALIHWVDVLIPKVHWVNVLLPKDFGLIGAPINI